MPSLSLLLLCVAYAAADRHGESFIVLFPEVGERHLTPAPSPDDYASQSPQSTQSYAPGSIVHLTSNGTVLGFRHEKISQWPPNHLIVNTLNDSVCWMFAPPVRFRKRFDAPGPVMRCAPLANLSDSWDLPEPRLRRLTDVVKLAFDELNHNWYLTVKGGPVRSSDGQSYVCDYLFGRCLRLEAFGLGERFLIEYDIPNRLIFRITNSKEEGRLYQLEAMQLDGSGKHVLARGLNEPRSLAVDGFTKQVSWLEDTYRGAELFTISYDGKGRRRVAMLDDSVSRTLMDAVDGEVFVRNKNTKTIDRIDLNTGEHTTLLGNWDKVHSVPWSPRQEFLAFKRVQRFKKPNSLDICSARTSGCRDFCVPSMVNGAESKSCFCDDGYELEDFECRQKYDAYTVVAAGHALLAIDLQTDQVTTILFNLTNATKLDFFWKGGEEYLLFWVDDGSVFTGQWSPGGPVSHVQLKKRPRDGSRVMELAVDRASQQVYWLIKDDNTYEEGSVAILQMAPFQGLHVKTIFINSWEDQRDLNVYSLIGIGFFAGKENASWTFHELILPAGFPRCGPAVDGVNPASLLVTQPLTRVQGIPVFFWVDRASQSVELVTVRRWQRRHLVSHHSLSDPRSLDVLRSRFLWLDSQGQLWTADIPEGRRIERDSPTAPRMVPGVAGGRAVRLLHPSGAHKGGARGHVPLP